MKPCQEEEIKSRGQFSEHTEDIDPKKISTLSSNDPQKRKSSTVDEGIHFEMEYLSLLGLGGGG